MVRIWLVFPSSILIGIHLIDNAFWKGAASG